MTDSRQSLSGEARKLTPRQRVLEKIPMAYACRGHGFYAGMWAIRQIGSDNLWSNHHRTAAAAWADAYRRINGR